MKLQLKLKINFVTPVLGVIFTLKIENYVVDFGRNTFAYWQEIM